MSSTCPIGMITVLLADDTAKPYPRPGVLEIFAAHDELRRLDTGGQLPDEVAEAVRVLLAAVGRMSSTGMAEAFPPDLAGASRPRLRVVESGDEL